MAGELPTLAAGDVPAVTRDQMREVDRLMIEEYGIQLVQMMEHAGLQLARLALHLGVAERQRILIVAGGGNNGGGGLVAARRLSAWGVGVSVLLADPPDAFEGVPALQLDILHRMEVTTAPFAGRLPGHELIADALLGYGLSGPPRGVTADMIEAVNASAARVVSLDAPSGVDVGSGEAPGDAARATATLTLALPKTGLLKTAARQFVGDLYLADIGVPAALYEQMGLGRPQPFSQGPLVRLVS